MNVGERVKHRKRPDCGVGTIVRIYPDGHCDATFPSGDFSWVPLATFASIAEEERARRAKDELLFALRKLLKDDYIQADSLFQASWAGHLSAQEYEDEKASFVRHWVKDLSGRELDKEQATAVACVHGDAHVTARAGSGKTTTLVSRALFLSKHCGVSPNEMLLLAFNRKAAEEMSERITATLGSELPHVMTFHALAYAIVHPEESILHNGPPGESQGLSRAFQQVIDDHLRIPTFKGQLRELMLAHFREDWDRIVEGCYDKGKDELLQFRRSLPRESLRGEYVKSFGEKVIADFLFEHDIPYKYERNHWWGGINYRPDFTLFRTDNSSLIVEYFGLVGDPDYDELCEAKRDYWRNKHDWALLEFTPADITAGDVEGFRTLLKTSLERQGVPCVRLSEDEIWNRIRDRAIDRFTAASVGFIGRCRKRWLSPDELDDLIKRYTALSATEDIFLKLARILYGAYLDRLVATGEEDFDGLMQRASEAVRKGTTTFERKAGRGNIAQLRYVLVDEFQDFSELFFRLVTAIREQNPQISFFCVGDDWQAINGFAGSDLRFFRDFGRYFDVYRSLSISTNYRSARSIVYVGNALMGGLGVPAVASKESAGEVLLLDLTAFEPSVVEKQRHPGDVVTPVVLRVVSKALSDDLDVVLLSRRNGLPWFINYHHDDSAPSNRGLERYLDLIRSFFPKGLQGRISISTTHKYKGRESDVVVILDAVARSYPLIHPDWAFSRLLGDGPQKITEEERRLFYVALTRGIEKLVIITEKANTSPFLDDIRDTPCVSTISWADYPALQGANSRVVVQIGNQERKGMAPTFAIKDALKAAGYQWNTTGWKGWAKSLPAEGFNIGLLQGEVWAAKADGIEVRVLSERDSVLYRYVVDDGKWKNLFGPAPDLFGV